MTDSPRTSPRRRGRVPLDQRSVLATTPGVPWWGALACAVAATLVGFLVDSARGSQLTWIFTVLYFLGCVAAVLMVRNRSLFTAMAQPPLILLVAVPLAYRSFADNPAAGLKGILFDMALPLIDRFPTMIVTTVIVVVIGAFRLTLYVQERRVAARGTTKNPTKKTSAGGPAADDTPSPGGNRQRPARGARRAGRGRAARSATAAADSRDERTRAQGRTRSGGDPGRSRRRGAAADPPFEPGGPRGADGTPRSNPVPPRAGTNPRRRTTSGEVAAAARVESRRMPRTSSPDGTAARAARRVAVGHAADGHRGATRMHDADPAHPVPHVRYRGD
ncbi:DUF6542 domain-containing protein [Tomitella gaofuii]|uniref:DUF6542 domain-containing protein n=1 Tax=Tomitella gaofuii TaxID=2760083 RepID=UPI0015FDCECA|nr:DUF6542 domain-containing protein [Tomitella gaofuii]